MIRTLAAASFLLAVSLPAEARDCRVIEAPPGVRVSPPPGCPPASRNDTDAQKAGSRPGFIRLENGTEIRIGGRVRVESLGSR